MLGGVISGSAGLTKDGPGTLNLTAANTYTGTTTIDTGTLLVNGVQARQRRDGRFGHHPGWDRDGRLDHDQRGDSEPGRRGPSAPSWMPAA